MADNATGYRDATTQTTSLGVFAFDECTINATDVLVARSKIGFGADGTYSEVASGNPFPVYLASAGTLPADASTATLQTAGNASLAAIATSLAGTLTVGSHEVTNAGTFAVQVDGDALTSLQLTDNIAQEIAAATTGFGVNVLGNRNDSGGNVQLLCTDTGVALISPVPEHNQVFPSTGGGPFVIGAYASEETPTAVGGDGRAVRLWANRFGVLRVESLVNGAIADNGNGTVGLSTQRVTLASDSTGTLAGVTTVGAVTAITNALPAGTNLLGRIASSDETSTIYNGTTALTPKFATIAASSSGNNTIVAAVTSKKIRVLAYNFIGNGAVNAKFQSGAGGTDLTGLKYIAAAGGGICAGFNPVGWFETASNTLLNLNLSGAVAVGGEIVYVEV